MFDNSKYGFIEFKNKLYRRIDIHEVIIRNFLSMQLSKNFAPVAKKNCLLMRIFSVTQTLFRTILYYLPFFFRMKIIINSKVVAGNYFKGFGGKTFSLFKCGFGFLFF